MQRCELCSVDVPHENALRAHLNGRKHSRNVDLERNNEVAARSIFVSPLPTNVHWEELINFFFQFGNIYRYSFRQNNVLIEFEKKESVDYLVNTPIWMKNIKLNIKRKFVYTKKEPKQQQPDQSNAVNPLSYDNLKSIFEADTSFDDQLTAFFNTVQLSDDEVEARYGSVVNHLDRILRSIFPRCQIYKFGSSQTGLGFKESDLDIYIDIGEPVLEAKYEQHIGWTMQKIFRDVKKLMYRMNNVFSNIVPIPRAKIPIIKFRHVPTNISCDISFKSGLGMHNSDFIRHCLTLDVRLRPLMIIIKYWARHFELSGTGKISNYALVMLILFYLQQPSVGIFPPIYELQKNCDPILINGWQVNFNQDIKLSTTNNSTVPELLQGFFAFYGSFELKGKVLCPLDGIAHEDEEFRVIEGLPDCMIRYKENLESEDPCLRFPTNRSLCVQDPFELCCNITAMTPNRILELFRKHCIVGAEICVTESKEEYKHLFKTLFTTLIKLEKKYEVRAVIPSGSFLQVGLPEDFKTRTDIVDRDQFIIENWYFTIFNIVKDIFEKVMKLQVEILSCDNDKKQQKIKVLSDVHTKGHQRIMLHCTGQDCVWRNRKSCQLILDPSLSCLEKEAAVTDRVLRDVNAASHKIRLDFLCRFDKLQNPVQVMLTFSDKNSEKNIFKHAADFIKSRLSRIVDRTLIHMQQFNKRYS